MLRQKIISLMTDTLMYNICANFTYIHITNEQINAMIL